MKILIISFYSPWENGRVNNVYRSLLNSYETTIITSEVNIPLEYQNNKISITGFKKKNGIGGYLRTLLGLRSLILNSFKKHDYDLIYFCDYLTTPLYSFLSLKLKLKRKLLVYDAYELYLPFVNNNFRHLIFHYFERKVIYNFDLLISANYERSLIMTGYYKLNEVPLDLNNVGIPLNNYKARDSYSLPLKIVYIGYISKEREILKFIKDLNISNYKEDFVFTIYGKGQYIQVVKEYLLSNNIKNVVFGGAYSQKDLDTILSSQDIGYLFYPNDDYNNIYCEPLKLFDYTSRGIPVVSYSNKSLFNKLSSNEIGISDNDIVKSILEIKKNYEKYSLKCMNYSIASNWYNEEEKLIHSINRLYEKN